MSNEAGRFDLEQIKRENAVLRKYAAMQKAAEDRIGCQKIYVDIAGGIPEAFVLDELIFFTLPQAETGRSKLRVWKDGVLWMAVSRTEWRERKRLTAKEADGAIERLLKQNLIFKDYFLFNKQKTTHLRLNTPEFFRRYVEELAKQNPPEDETDSTQKDIADLYETLGILKRDTFGRGIPFKEGVSLNGDSINSLHTIINDDDNESARLKEKRGLEELAHRTALFSKLYEGNIGAITPLAADMIQDAVKDYPEETWYEAAMKIAVANQARSLAYVLKILDGWNQHGFGWKPEFKQGAKHANGAKKQKVSNAGGGQPDGLSPETQAAADEANRRRAEKQRAGLPSM